MSIYTVIELNMHILVGYVQLNDCRCFYETVLRYCDCQIRLLFSDIHLKSETKLGISELSFVIK